METAWINALIKLYEDKLHLNTNTMKGNKKAKIEGYLSVLGCARNKVILFNDKELTDIYKNYFYDLYINNNHNIHTILDQRESLDQWILFFVTDEDGKKYSDAVMFWVLEGLSKLGRYDADNNIFYKRDKTTKYPFALFNKKALMMTIFMLDDYFKTKKVPNNLKDALGQANFKRLYESSLNALKKEKATNNDLNGIWKKYDRGSSYATLKEDTKESNWCIAWQGSFAKEYLALCDFYIYYTKDENDSYTIPRIAIRVESNTIKEIRGIDKDQNVEYELLSVLEEMLNQNEYINKNTALKKISDMKYLLKVYNKSVNNEELTKEDLDFVYEKNARVESFADTEDNLKLDYILKNRNEKKDLATVYNVKENQIALDMNEVNKDTIVCNSHFNSYYLKTDYPNLKIVLGNVSIIGDKKIINMNNLEFIKGSLFAGDLEDASNLSGLKYIGKSAYLSKLNDFTGLENLSFVGANIYGSSFKKEEELKHILALKK